MAAADNIVLVDASGGARTITLPTPTNGRILTVKDLNGNAGTNNITVNPSAAETIDGAASYVLSANFQSVEFTSDGTNWSVIADAKTSTSSGITQLTGDVTAGPGSGSQAATVAKIQGTTVSGTTGTVNVVFSASPTLTGTITAAAANFSGAISASNFSGSSSGTNTGDVTLAAIGAVPNANAASLSGQVLNLQPANASFGGVVTTGTQTLAGDKTLTGNTLIAQATASQATIGLTASSAQHLINGGLRVTTNTVSTNYTIV